MRRFNGILTEIDNDFSRRSQQFQNVLIEIVSMEKDKSDTPEAKALSRQFKQYIVYVNSAYDVTQALRPPRIHNKEAKKQINTALANCKKFYTMQVAKVGAFLQIGSNPKALDIIEAANSRADQYAAETALAMIAAYSALGVDP